MCFLSTNHTFGKWAIQNVYWDLFVHYFLRMDPEIFEAKRREYPWVNDVLQSFSEMEGWQKREDSLMHSWVEYWLETCLSVLLDKSVPGVCRFVYFRKLEGKTKFHSALSSRKSYCLLLIHPSSYAVNIDTVCACTTLAVNSESYGVKLHTFKFSVMFILNCSCWRRALNAVLIKDVIGIER